MWPENTEGSLEDASDKGGGENQTKVQGWIDFWLYHGWNIVVYKQGAWCYGPYGYVPWGPEYGIYYGWNEGAICYGTYVVTPN